MKDLNALGSVPVSSQAALLRQMSPGKARGAGNGCSLVKSRNAAWRHLPRNPKGRACFSAILRFSSLIWNNQTSLLVPCLAKKQAPARPRTKREQTLATCCLLTLLASPVLAADDASCQKVRLGAVGWTDVVATTAVAAELLDRLGYQSTQTQASQQMIFAGIQRKQIDAFLGYWKPIMDENIQPFLANGAVKVAAEPSLNDAVAILAVPTYTAEAGLRSFADIARFKNQLDGKIYGIESGSGANTVIQQLIDTNQFGLGEFKLIESSEAAMLTAVTRAVKDRQPVLFFGWKPHPMNIQMPITYLTGSQDAFGPNDGAASVSTVTAPDFAARCPNAHRLLTGLRFTSAQEAELMEPIMAREAPASVARAWLKANPAVVSSWLDGVTSFDGKQGAQSVVAKAE
jgi:glycine betaine/proline transport system substrate-binding protein